MGFEICLYFAFNSTLKIITLNLHNRFSIIPNSHHECQPMLRAYPYFCSLLPKHAKAPPLEATKKSLFAAFVLITASTFAAAANDLDGPKKQEIG